MLRKLTCLHALNHVVKTRDRVIKNNSKIGKENDDAVPEVRDQGFTRPKILIILPTRQSVVKYIDSIVSFYGPEQQENKKRFLDEYSREEHDLPQDKPEDFKELFGGNDDDLFRLGLKFTRKTIKFFSKFYNSDIIFGSPLGLFMTLTGGKVSKKADHDFLSSIEILIVDQANALLMQNLDHLEYILQHLNLQPKEAHGCDFSRVRHWYLDGYSRHLRQTLVFSAFNCPSLNGFYTRHMLNIEAKVKYTFDHPGAMLDLNIPVKQTFSRFDSLNAIDEPDTRFKYFCSAILPSVVRRSEQRNGGQSGILIYLPGFVDFVKVRNHLATSSSTQNISFGSISEYSSVKDVARARSHFLSGRHSVLLYTERAHHFSRYHIRGVKRIIFYGLPENAVFYSEIAGFLASSIAEAKLTQGDAAIRSLFSQYDILKLERIVGSSRCKALLRNRGGDTFDFV